MASIHNSRQVFLASITCNRGSITHKHGSIGLLVIYATAFVLKMDDTESEGDKPVLDSNFKADCATLK